MLCCVFTYSYTGVSQESNAGAITEPTRLQTSRHDLIAPR
ncbi:hypothetical protein P20652_1240 [Pseudoalteromonas sp. BSi20652]|nr:hypothetical protein P20652_1240 [Pseudoalteromonas sp. BSi20652]